MKLNLDQFIFALSDTVDLVGVDEILHSKRVGYMAYKCAQTLGYDNARQKRLLHLGLLHDCGVSSTKERRKLVNELDWENSDIHCQIGAERMEFFEPLKPFAQAIRHHHTRWDKLKDQDITEETKLEANLLYMLDRVDYLGLVTPGPNWLFKKDVVRHKINFYSGTYFHPDLVDIFLNTSESEAFWFSLDSLILMDFIEQQKKAEETIFITSDQISIVAELFARIVDAKSPFTAEHSFGVARLSKQIAEYMGLDKDTCLKIEVTGLLHDLGKLQVPDRVLENPGPLDGEDLSCMRHHSYVTFRILKKITGFEDIALWASNHHEALDGSGYPFRRKGDEIGIESRILAIADIFQALAQNRPYRQAQPLEKIITFLQTNAEKGRLDTKLVGMVTDNKEQCYQLAMEY